MNVAHAIEEKLAALQPQRLQIVDESHLHVGHAGAKSGGHYRLTIVSPQFSGKNTVARHRMIYAALDTMMQQHIHALAIRAYAPGEAEDLQNS